MTRSVRRAAAITIIMAAVAYFAIRGWSVETPERPAEPQFRMPVANPPLEPDRPDLIGEPRPPEPPD